MNKKLTARIFYSLLSLLLLSPAIVLVYAFDPGSVPDSVNISIVGLIDIIFSILWPIIVAIIVIMFVIAGFKYLAAQGDPGKVAEANKFVIWGVVGVVVILLAWSITRIIKTRLGV